MFISLGDTGAPSGTQIEGPESIFDAAQQGVGRVQVLGSKIQTKCRWNCQGNITVFEAWIFQLRGTLVLEKRVTRPGGPQTRGSPDPGVP